MQRRFPSALFALLIGAVLAGSLTEAQEPRPFLFACGHYQSNWASRPWSYDEQCFDHLANIGATLTGSGLAWCDGEPSPGYYDPTAWAYADFMVDEILARGMEPTFFLGLSPEWAALRPDLPPHRTPPAEEYVAEFIAFHQDVAAHFAGRVKYYYFWNEPNGCSWINDGCSNSDGYPLYTQWLIRCSQAVKSVDPSAKIIAANIDYHSGVTHGYEYIQGMYDYGAGPYFDIISIHPYDWAGTIHWQAILDTRAVMVANGDADKPIWVSEYGWNQGTEQNLSIRLSYVLTELKKPEWSYVEMANYLVLNDGPGVENYGLADADLNPRARYWTFKNFDKTWPVFVDFSADVTEGPTPLAVSFTDESSIPGAHTWYWQFGDGGTSYDQNPTYTYNDDGMYTVTLTVTGDGAPQSETKPDYIRAGTFPPVSGVENPSFEDNGGSLDGWEIVWVGGEGPDNPPWDNSNPYGPHTNHGTHFGGKITNGLYTSFYLGQVVGTTDWDAAAPAADWALSAYVQLNSTHEELPNPDGVHQVWQIGWNDDGSDPVDISTCDNWLTVADIDGDYTGNDAVNFYHLGASGTIGGVTGLRGVVVRVHMFSDSNWWWTLTNCDNLQFSLTSVGGVETPAGFYDPGWNLTSVPVEPADAEAGVVFADLVDLGNALGGNLYSYAYGAGYSVYPGGFSQVEHGRGYWLYLTNAPADAVVGVAGLTPTDDVEIPLTPGWNLIGHPFDEWVSWGSCMVTTGSVTKTIAQAAAAGWIQGEAYAYDEHAYVMVTPDATGDDFALRPWYGYWFMTKGPGLTLIVPAP